MLARDWWLKFRHQCKTFSQSYINQTRNIGTVHTSATLGSLTSVAIWIGIRNSDHHQNLVICQPSLKISCKSIQKFLRKVVNRHTDKQWWLHILHCGSNDWTSDNTYRYENIILLVSEFNKIFVSATFCTDYFNILHGFRENSQMPNDLSIGILP